MAEERVRGRLAPIYTFDPYEDYPWRTALGNIYEDGVRRFSFLLPLPLAWNADGTFDFGLLDRLMEEILRIAPEGRFLPRIFMTTPDWWDAEHPEELLRFSGTVPRIPRFPRENQALWRYETKLYHGVDNPSVASRLWVEAGRKALKAYLVHAEEIGFPLMGAMPVYGTCGEWGQFGSFHNGMFGNADFSRPMVEFFRKELRRRYGTDERLQAAWGSRRVTLDTALPPDKVRRMQTQDHNLRSPGFYRPCLDYFEAYSTAKAQAVEAFCHAVKEVDRHLLAGTFGGALQQCASSAYFLHMGSYHTMLEKLLELPSLDFLSAPNVYFDRRTGNFSQAVPDTISRRKLFIAECDVRTGLSGDRHGPLPGESRDQFLLETGCNLCSGSGAFWWYDFGRNWYREEAVRKVVRQLMEVFAELPCGAGGRNDMALVFSPDSLTCSEGNIGYYRLLNEFHYRELLRCRCGFTVMTDKELPDRPPCRLYIFRDKLLCTETEARRIRGFLERNHASAIWMGPAGAVSETEVDFSRCRDLTGISVQAIPHMAGPVSITLTNAESPLLSGRILPQATAPVEKLETVSDPVLFADDCRPEEVLGLVESVDLPGMVIRQDGGRFDLWSAMPYIDWTLMLRLAEKAGIVPLFEADAPVVLHGSGQLLVLRADGAANVVFPASVSDALTGGDLGRKFSLKAKETILLRIP